MSDDADCERPQTPGFAKNEWDLRAEIVARCRELNDRGINQGTSGNVSARCGDGFLISPSGFPYDLMQPKHVVAMRFDGSWDGKIKPSSEWRFHLDILRERRDVQAVIHAHPIYCTTLAILGRDIPSLHYMIAITGRDSTASWICWRSNRPTWRFWSATWVRTRRGSRRPASSSASPMTSRCAG